MGALGRLHPKPLFPILNCPLVGWAFRTLIQAGIREALINTHHLFGQFQDLPGVTEPAGMQLRLVEESVLSGPVGGVLSCAHAIPTDCAALVLHGDGMYDFDLGELRSVHDANKSLLTIGVAGVEDGSQYGVVETDERRRVVSMAEKPRGVGPVSAASCGVFLLDPALIAMLRSRTFAAPLDWVHVVQLVLEAGEVVSAAPIKRWSDVGAPQALLATNLEALRRGQASVVSSREIRLGDSTLWLQGPVPNLARSTFHDRVVVGAMTSLGTGSVIRNSVVGGGSVIGEGAQLEDCVVLPGGLVHRGQVVVGGVVGSAT